MDYEIELTGQTLVLLIEQAGVTFGIPLCGMNQLSELHQTLSQVTMDKEFFQRNVDVARLGKSNGTESATLDNAIAEAAQSPKRVQGDAGSVEQHSLQDLIAADKFLQSKKATQNGLGVRLHKLSPDGTV
jgi:hypothetical protein